jgi:hypothetical protein
MKKVFKLFLCLSFLTIFFGFGDFSEKKSTHFIIYYKDIPEDFLDDVLEYSERYYDELTEKLGFRRFNYWTWDNRAKIYIFEDKETYEKEMNQPAWAGGSASYVDKTIWTFPQESGFFDTLLPHEIGHIVFREVVGAHRNIPLWLEEGVAQYLEQAKRIGAEKHVLSAMSEGAFIPFKELMEINGLTLRSRDDVKVYYAEASSLVNYLIQKYGVDSFNNFCSKLKDGKTFDNAISYAYFYIRNSSDLGEAWEQYLKDKLKIKDKMVL